MRRPARKQCAGNFEPSMRREPRAFRCRRSQPDESVLETKALVAKG
jgi:hypothetical protein